MPESDVAAWRASGGYDGTDRRAAPRVRVDTPTTFALISAPSIWKTCWMIDASISGLRLRSLPQIAPPIGSRLMVRWPFRTGAALTPTAWVIGEIVRHQDVDTTLPLCDAGLRVDLASGGLTAWFPRAVAALQALND